MVGDFAQKLSLQIRKTDIEKSDTSCGRRRHMKRIVGISMAEVNVREARALRI